MKKIKIISCLVLLIMCADVLFGQKQRSVVDTLFIISSEPYENKLVKSCNTNSNVVNMSAKMEVAKGKLPKIFNNNEFHFYVLKNKGKTVKFFYSKELNGGLSVWIDKNEKHCFKIDSLSKYSFNSYFLSNESLEVYGKIGWDKYYRNFRLIFYFKNPDVFFDFDDEILRKPK